MSSPADNSIPNRVLIAPSLLAANFARLSEEIRAVELAGADWLHLDVMDGQFVPPITFGDLICSAARDCCSLPLDVHLMIENPERQIDAFAKAGAHYLTVHVEACKHLHRTMQQIRDAGMKAGVSMNPATPVAAVEGVLEVADLVLVMSVNPGWGGQRYITSADEKLSQLRSWRDSYGLNFRIEVDGGIATSTAKRAVMAGADVLVAGTAVFKGDSALNMKALRDVVSQ